MTNQALQLAWEFVSNTSRNIFLTGKAGTGKTTFLHKLKSESVKRMIVVAPTGVAAINARGVTIHSFFQLPFGPLLPNDRTKNTSFIRKFSKKKINLIKSLDLIVIDEISMVRADVLDGIDRTLKRYRDRNLPFGGVQVLMIGDLKQLSPVVKDDEWRLLKDFYNNMFFFSSKVYQACSPVTIELQHIYRQSNPVFINILNEIRDDRLSKDAAAILNKNYQPDFKATDHEGYVYLTTHNHKATVINKKELSKIDHKPQSYEAQIEGAFSENAYPNDVKLSLKKKAQVMFIKNDSSLEKRYYNGKIGTVIALDQEEVVVKCPEDDHEIIVTPERWENIKYNVDQETKVITEDRLGSFTQIPLRLAWAITIHKSQGLTFEKAVIDAQDAFAHGQTYVALSRCKTLEGLVLKSKISPDQIINNGDVLDFDNHNASHQPSEEDLLESKHDYQLNLLKELFNYYDFLSPINRLVELYHANKSSIEGNLLSPLELMKNEITKLLQIATKFHNELIAIASSQKEVLPESNTHLQERYKKAITYFVKQHNDVIVATLQKAMYSTDNKAVKKDVDKQLDRLEELSTIKSSYFKGLKDEFSTEKFTALRVEAVFTAQQQATPKRNMVIDSTSNKELFQQLKDLRNDIAEREEKVHYQIFTQKSLFAMCELLPTTTKELLSIHGMGKTRVAQYGEEILEIINSYLKTNPNAKDAVMVSHEEPSKPKVKKGHSQRLSLKMYQDGKSMEQIATERELNPNTIFGHLASFIPSGEIKTLDLISKKRFDELKNIIPQKVFENLSDLKKQLGDEYSYGELKIVLSEMQVNK